MDVVSVGLDISLRNSGLATLGLAGCPVHLQEIASEGEKTDSLWQRESRLRSIASEVIKYSRHADIVVIEAPYGSSIGHSHDRSGLWWLIVGALISKKVRVVEASPSSLKKYSTGDGKASKDLMISVMQRKFPGAEVTSSDVADALGLACMGMRLMGYPIDGSLSKASMDAFNVAIKNDPGYGR